MLMATRSSQNLALCRRFHTSKTQRRHRCVAASQSSFDHLVGPGEQTDRPSAFAMFRLITNFNFVGCSIGSSQILGAERPHAIS
jgi:hypothetical protein